MKPFRRAKRAGKIGLWGPKTLKILRKMKENEALQNAKRAGKILGSWPPAGLAQRPAGPACRSQKLVNPPPVVRGPKSVNGGGFD